MSVLSVAVAGATGYAGGEALRILARHPDFAVTCVTGHSSVGERLGSFLPHIPQYADLRVQDTTADVLRDHDVVIMALPHGASGTLADDIGDGPIMVDLGADHRLQTRSAWEDFYGGPYHPAWAYGMPELILGSNADGTIRRGRDELRGAHRIAGPGCNVTAVTLAIQPAIHDGLIDERGIVADLVVGYSGAGKSLKRTGLLAAEALGSAVPYGVGGTHRHIPEIQQNLAHAAGLAAEESARFPVSFTPVLAPMSRGILAVVSAPLSAEAMAASDAQIRESWERAYAGQSFMVLLDPGTMPATANVIGSNAAHIQVAVDRRAGRLIAMSAIDNLTRGTAGQAVQSLNIALGLPEDQGLTTIGVAP